MIQVSKMCFSKTYPYVDDYFKNFFLEAFFNHLYGSYESESLLESICTEDKSPAWKVPFKGHKRTLHFISNDKVGLWYFIEDAKPQVRLL